MEKSKWNLNRLVSECWSVVPILFSFWGVWVSENNTSANLWGLNIIGWLLVGQISWGMVRERNAEIKKLKQQFGDLFDHIEKTQKGQGLG